MEKFPCFAVGFWWKDQDASRARIFSWSGGDGSACDEGFNGGDGEAGGDSGSIGDYGYDGGSCHYTNLPHHRNHHNQLM